MNDGIQNELLNALPVSDLASVRSHARRVDLPAGEILQRPAEPVAMVFFPDSGVISLLNVLETGQNAAVAVVGREGVVGASIVLGIRTAPPWHWAIVQVETGGLAVPADAFLQLFHELQSLRQVTLTHLGHLMQGLSRSSVCHRFHSHRQRLARWLVELVRKSGQNSLPLTHDAIAQTVGAPRHAVTTALNELRSAGAIEYLRGHISVSDQARLITHACECCERD